MAAGWSASKVEDGGGAFVDVERAFLFFGAALEEAAAQGCFVRAVLPAAKLASAAEAVAGAWDDDNEREAFKGTVVLGRFPRMVGAALGHFADRHPDKRRFLSEML